jgi:hypothetical protein
MIAVSPGETFVSSADADVSLNEKDGAAADAVFLELRPLEAPPQRALLK